MRILFFLYAIYDNFLKTLSVVVVVVVVVNFIDIA